MLPNLSTLALSPGNVLVRCPECATLFRRTSPTGCAECGGGKRKREEEKKECECKKEKCACDDDVDVPDPNDPNTSEQWKNAFLEARGTSYGSLSLRPDNDPEPWQVAAAKRKLAKLDKAQGFQPPFVRPDLDPDKADEPVYESGCPGEDCEPVYESGCPDEDCEPVYQSCGGEDCDEAKPLPSLSSGNESGEDGAAAWMFANFSEERDREMEKRYGGLEFRSAEQVEKPYAP